MSKLAPCPHCKRHVRITETACPFCAGALSEGLVVRPSVSTRGLSRASILALGASLATVAGGSMIEGCADEPDPGKDEGESGQAIYGAPVQPDAGTNQPPAKQDGGTNVAIYGAPVQPDGGRVTPVYGAPVQPPDAGQNQGSTTDAGVSDAGKDAGSSDAGSAADAGKDAAVISDDGGRVAPVYGAPVPFYGAPVQPSTRAPGQE